MVLRESACQTILFVPQFAYFSVTEVLYGSSPKDAQVQSDIQIGGSSRYESNGISIYRAIHLNSSNKMQQKAKLAF